MHLAPNYLRDLPYDKSHHVFICYESRNVDIVQQLVANLEERGITCCFYDRDFLPGRPVMENMTAAIRKSLHMVVILSENFQESHYCMHEVGEAMYLRMRGQYNLIPVKVEPCSVPECLQHISYIDAEDDIDNAHMRIIDAMAKNDIQTSLQDVKNGECLQFKVQPYKPSRFSLTRYRLTFSESDKAKIWDHQFELPRELLDDIADKVNKSLFFKYLHVWSNMQLAIATIVLILLTIVVVVFLVALSQSKTTKVNGLPPAGYVLVIGIPFIIVFWITSCCLSCCTCKRQNGRFSFYHRAFLLLRDKLSQMSKEKHDETGVIFYLWTTLNFEEDIKPEQIEVHFMRYNMKPCKMYFRRKLDVDEALLRCSYETETKEEYTDRIFQLFLKKNSHTLELASSDQRHKMANGAKCLCLMIEECVKNN